MLTDIKRATPVTYWVHGHKDLCQDRSPFLASPIRTMVAQVVDSPFIDERAFSVAQLCTISFTKLVDKDPSEQEKLLTAVENDGFFYLDLLSPDSKNLLEDYDQALSITSAWFDRPLEFKLSFAYGSDVQGFVDGILL